MTSNEIKELINPENALRVYDKIFTARTGQDIFFTSRIPKKGIVVPPPPLSFYEQWNQHYRKAFLAAVQTTGKDAFYLSLTTRIGVSYRAKPSFEKEFTEAVLAETTSTSPYAEKVTPVINDWIYPLNIDWHVDAEDLTGLDYAVYSLDGT